MSSRYIAGISLALMAAGFIVTLFLPDYTWIILLRGGFEAGLVGGLADWFAVTALFRHPMGIPIPHTSLLLKNKNRIVQSLISAVENELLNKESIEDKLKKINIFNSVARWLTKLLRKRHVRENIVAFAIDVVRKIPLQEVVSPLQKGMEGFTRQIDLKPVADTLLTKAMEHRLDDQALDFVLDKASHWIAKPETAYQLGKLASEKLNAVNVKGFMGFAVQAISGFMSEDKLGAILQGMLTSAIRDLSAPDNEYRAMVIKELRIQLFQLASDDDKLMVINEKLADYLISKEGEQFLHSQLDNVRSLMISKLDAAKENGAKAVFRAFRAIVRMLNKDSETIQSWEEQLSSAIIGIVETNHHRIGQLIQENVDRMDDQTLVTMLEEKIGKDLQWIRVNGALCGFMVGIVLSVIQL
ncbi:MAG: DUF445 domain-containing protein [Candidatus Cohnella colombiensis]|uniref:DUF445 domain-containing protein n=1 Tax=Candidatus Cohnella colombiensis TaxID=3121368 RepID=A0AA95JHC5_9BACL|nr:MAG: DUF445 domain-containing protein [Cohnella sp.]